MDLPYHDSFSIPRYLLCRFGHFVWKGKGRDNLGFLNLGTFIKTVVLMSILIFVRAPATLFLSTVLIHLLEVTLKSMISLKAINKPMFVMPSVLSSTPNF